MLSQPLPQRLPTPQKLHHLLPGAPFPFALDAPYSPAFASASDAPELDINSARSPTNTGHAPMNSFLDEPPSRADSQCSLSASIIVSQEPFLHSDSLPYPAADPAPPHNSDSASNRTSRQASSDKYPSPNSLLDQRRMSEPALFAPAHQDSAMPPRFNHPQFAFTYSSPTLQHTRSAAPLYVSSLHRGASTGSLRDLRHHHFEYPPQQQEWKHDDSRQRDHHHLDFYDHRADSLDEPTSPMQNTFAHSLLGSPGGLQYSPISDNLYGPSPPGTGTSTSSSVAPLSAGIPTSPSHSISQHLHRSLSASQISGDGLDRKTYSFVALPGNAVKKRPRRRYDEIERLYVCSWPDCNKSYGTLNHLNAHVTMQKHGAKRSPNEFKDLRKQWRKAKKEQEVAAAAMRRDSFSDGYDDHQAFSHRYMAQHHGLSHRQLSGSVIIGTAERYSVPIDDIRYPLHERDDGLGYEPTQLTARQRYGHGQPASWHDGSQMSARINAVQQQHSFGNGDGLHSSSSLPSYPSQHAHHSQLPQLHVGGSRLHSHPSTVPNSQSALMHQSLDGAHQNGRLPESSTLLTPLPGYPASTLMSSMQTSGGGMSFGVSAEGYELYETDIDNGSRPGTGHASLGGHASADEYSQ